jgi:hypothetical protein
MTITPLFIALGSLGLSVAALLVVRRRSALLWLLAAQYAAAAVVVMIVLLSPYFVIGLRAMSTAWLITAALGVTVTAVLGLTLWLLRPARLQALREAQMDEFALAAARRARRKAAQAPPPAVNWGEWLLPVFATGLAGIAAGALTRLYPLGAGAAGDLSFYWPALSGLMLLMLTRDLLRLGVALLLLLQSGSLLAGLLAGRFEAVAGGLPALGTVIVALALAYIYAAEAAYGEE